MERQYSHLTWKNRLKIRRMLDERRKPKEIADALHVHTSTIYREIKRGQTWQMTSEWEYVQKYCPEMTMPWPPIWKRRSGRSTIPRRRH